MTTEEILRQQIAELEKLVKLKDERINELTKKDVSWPFRPFQPNNPYKMDLPYWNYTKIYCGSSTDGVTVTSNETNFTGLSDLP